MPSRMRESESDPVDTERFPEAVEGDLSEDGTSSELDLKLAGLAPSEHTWRCLHFVGPLGSLLGQRSRTNASTAQTWQI